MRGTLRYSLIIWVCSCIFFTAGCGENKELTSKGYELLSETQYADAEDIFSEAISNTSSPEAYFGRGLSRMLSFIEIIDYVYTLIGGHPSDVNFSPFSADENYFLYNTLTGILRNIHNLVEGAYSDFTEVLENNNFYIRIKDLPVIIGREEILNLRGDWSTGDVYYLRSLASLFEGIFDILLSQNLFADYFSLFEYAKPILLEGGIDPGDPLKSINLAKVTNILVYLFHISPDFLDLNNEDLDGNGQKDGVEKWELSGERFKVFFEDLLTGLNFSKKGENSSFFTFIDEENSVKLATLYPGRETPVILSIELNEDFINALSKTAGSFENNDEVLLWNSDITPVLATVVITILKSGILSGSSNGIMDILSSVADYDLAKQFISQIFGSSIGISPAPFFSTPAGFREFLPLWRDDFPDPLSFNFALEWECSSYTGPPGDTNSYPSGSIFCEGPDFADSSHFSDTFFSDKGIDSIPPDGITSPAPYIAFLNPSFNGLLQTDVFSLRDLWNDFPDEINQIDPSEGYKPANNGEINVLIQYIFKIFGNFILP